MGRFFGSRFWGPRSEAGGVGTPPTTPTWTVADNGDGTGAIATITAGGSTTNTVYVERFDQTLGQGSWVSAGSRSGSGTVNLDLDVGHYLGYVKSTNASGASVSTPRYFAVTTDEDSVHYRCLLAVQTRIRAAALAGIADASVVVQKVPLPRDFFNSEAIAASLALPGVLISPIGAETMDQIGATNNRDNLGYPCLITMIAADNQDLTLDGTELRWRQQISRAFRKQRLPGVLESIMIKIENSPVILPESWMNNLWHSSLLIRVECREVRGLGA